MEAEPTPTVRIEEASAEADPAWVACVENSPRRVAEHDRQGWLDLFVEGGVVEDPVGTVPNRRGAGLDAQGRHAQPEVAHGIAEREVGDLDHGGRRD